MCWDQVAANLTNINKSISKVGGEQMESVDARLVKSNKSRLWVTHRTMRS